MHNHCPCNGNGIVVLLFLLFFDVSFQFLLLDCLDASTNVLFYFQTIPLSRVKQCFTTEANKERVHRITVKETQPNLLNIPAVVVRTYVCVEIVECLRSAFAIMWLGSKG